MIRLLSIFLISIISSNIFGQTEMKKPENYKFNVYYMDDSSVVFNNRLKFSSVQVPLLIEIFKKADKLDAYCKTHVDIIVEKLIDSINKYEFIYKFNPSNKLSAIAINTINESPAYINNFNKMSFVDYLIKYRDDYYIKIKAYNDKVNEVEVTLDAIMQ